MNEKELNELSKARIFKRISNAEIESLMDCIQGRIRTYSRNSYVFSAGDEIREIGIVMEGQLEVLNTDYWGNDAVINLIGPGEIFGEAYASDDSEPLPNDIKALKDSKVLFMNMTRILTTCQKSCSFHNQLIQNLYMIATRRNRYMNRKISHMSKRTTREKLLAYLSDEARMQGSRHFMIPFDRQQLADYLSVERSAMSAELSRMQKDGLISFHKNEFTLR
ncbi:Crp/Fnr family transcriptional regulator [Candidatus Weimeria sp. HCP3S3_B5]|uniref:Crp/Fnr family transcriptional regulator n=1 Tax=Candidatus Weimeria sp. HCP3S3_B5 TaxID=3438871 RepID=UPI002A94397A|nr:Crp/Fnr family transcriptional regulator [Lachnospiraceae bacterium]